MPNLCGNRSDGVIRACVEMWKKDSKGDTWQWNEEMKEAI